jgi:hypothetical protein
MSVALGDAPARSAVDHASEQVDLLLVHAALVNVHDRTIAHLFDRTSRRRVPAQVAAVDARRTSVQPNFKIKPHAYPTLITTNDHCG